MLPRPPEALYVHVPFCVSVCPYCDFVVVAGAAARGPRNRIESFVSALSQELELRADLADARWGVAGGQGRAPLQSLYFGGGTPSLIPTHQIAGLIGLVRRRFGLAADAEITIEANPGPDERGDASGLAGAGVNRISFGAQAMDAATLRSLGRRHRPTDVATAVSAARAAGIPSVSLDLLYDVPDASIASWASGLEAALALEPDHLSLYALTLDDPDAEGLTGPGGDHLPVTRGARAWRERAKPRQDDDRAAEMYEHAVDRLDAAGFHGYEISNWARPGHESRHNLAYWERRPYEAVGPGAHAFDGTRRRWNAAHLGTYLSALAPGDGAVGPGLAPSLPPGGEEVVGPRDAAAERVILGLRTSYGLPAALALEEPLAGSYEWAQEAGLLTTTTADRIVLTTRGRLLANELFARLV
ncbi:MAG: radical SAM family heme chaperone HemW [Chloroflexota bacterium]